MPSSDRGFCTIDVALDELRAGRMIVLVDDEHRENEGDVVMAAEAMTPAAVNFMIREACGRLCVSFSRPHADRLGLDLLPGVNLDPTATPFTHNFDARYGVTTGISAFDRCRTIQVCADPNSTSQDLVRDKGHMDGLIAKPGGVLVRAGHTEGSVDLCRLAGLREIAVICEVLNEDGTMARLPDLRTFCATHGLKMCTIADLIEHRRRREKLVRREIALKLPTDFGEFDLFAYTSMVDQEPHLALTLGGIGVAGADGVPVQVEPALVRMHSECLTGDVLHSAKCDCGPQLQYAMQQVAAAGRGVIVYMRQEGRGIGLLNKLKAYKLQQEEGLDTVEANRRLGFAPDLRHFGIGAQILHDLGVRDIKLLTNNPRKVIGLEGYGLRIVERVPIQMVPGDHNRDYLATKKAKLGHLLDELDKGGG
ncbi:-dihydroxy-2-butanone 4-phosphate synthase : 3,4-dihydroxy-2-butanone 4-phosphate synthase OS=Thermodesulfobacterium commune DSM 2178 GN=HL41_00245 PE=4 SV=1: DHBP_synthase: GTP_cyclohydro2 [Gemmataceae bacterium]|nr:-dihydroxy-2-butanone 4-phosphate synthase : 3,4-dihydroxy-2-butanone 4-phosphate synthase OS=Thermodesulfobacterium commune DSM 2178 GN=HL41_00245 PE=4 SV=1: DHBP_synthase: GTP_cyclohydro2 [Gemmataceae bacterium]VTT98419.1 -dihydroxy-2-butanone 4-phosphate synthase : 3,4-dihydroxy-2-butanone 4-phosphate synthase OS=Thermodesulfobacterium commune DSM 2178 GN=HL41_00245 PE=4 SV=1: DHBP_synthase: GTP_cyclohydro2 [Gemmataceae bacterium]